MLLQRYPNKYPMKGYSVCFAIAFCKWVATQFRSAGRVEAVGGAEYVCVIIDLCLRQF